METKAEIPRLSDSQFETKDLISKLSPIEIATLDKIQNEIESASIVWHQPYSEYASSGLEIAVLMSPDGRLDNFSWDDCENPLDSELLAKMPVLRRLLKSFGFKIMASRLLKLSPGTFLHEHRDYVYLKQVDRYRLHIPVITNSDAHIIMPGKKVHMDRGFLWKLDPKNTVHSASNFGGEHRIHIMMDCYLNENLESLLKSQKLEVASIEALPLADDSLLSQWIEEAKVILKDKDLVEAEEFLLKKFCLFDLQGKTTFDLLFEFCRQTNSESRLEYWKARSEEVYLNNDDSIA